MSLDFKKNQLTFYRKGQFYSHVEQLLLDANTVHASSSDIYRNTKTQSLQSRYREAVVESN